MKTRIEKTFLFTELNKNKSQNYLKRNETIIKNSLVFFLSMMTFVPLAFDLFFHGAIAKPSKTKLKCKKSKLV